MIDKDAIDRLIHEFVVVCEEVIDGILSIFYNEDDSGEGDEEGNSLH